MIYIRAVNPDAFYFHQASGSLCLIRLILNKKVRGAGLGESTYFGWRYACSIGYNPYSIQPHYTLPHRAVLVTNFV